MKGGDSYNGEWRAGHKYGQGEQKFQNGDFYEGQWKNDS